MWPVLLWLLKFYGDLFLWCNTWEICECLCISEKNVHSLIYVSGTLLIAPYILAASLAHFTGEKNKLESLGNFLKVTKRWHYWNPDILTHSVLVSLSLPMRSELLVALFKHSFFMPPCVVILRESVLRFPAMIVNVSVLLAFLSVVALYVLAMWLITSKLVYVTCSWWTIFLIPWHVVRQPLVVEGLAFPIPVRRHGGVGPSHKWSTPEGMMNLLSWDTTGVSGPCHTAMTPTCCKLCLLV